MKKIYKIILSALAVITLVIAGALWYFSAHLEQIVTKELKKQTHEISHGFYRLDIKDANISLLNRDIQLQGLRFEPDSAVFERLRAHDSLPITYFHIYLDEIRAKGFSLKEMKKTGKLQLSLFEIDRPQVAIFQRNVLDKNTNDTITKPKSLHERKKLYQLLPKALTSFGIDKMSIVNGTLNYRHVLASDTAVYSVGKLNLQIDRLQIDSTTSLLQKFYSDDLRFEIENAGYRYPGKPYALEVGKFDFSTAASVLHLLEVKLIPQHSKSTFAATVGADFMDLSVGTVHVAGIDFSKLAYTKILKADSLTIADIKFETFKNKQVPQKPKVKPMIYHGLQYAPIGVEIATLVLKNGNVTYEELPEHGNQSGSISFNSINATAQQVTNIISRPHQTFILEATAKMMDAGVVSAKFEVPVDTLYDRLQVTASLEHLDLNRLNPMITPLAHIKIESGHTDRVDFHMSANAHQSSVDMILTYKGLKIDIMKEKEHKLHQRKFASNVVNFFVLSDNHPKKGKEPKTVHATGVRDPHKSTFNYLWKSVMAGLKASFI